MSDLVAWLTKILDEDERWAASGANFHNWSPRNPWQLDDAVSVRDIAVNGIRVGTISTDYDEHVTRHDPASVLADIAAKRAIIERCTERERIYVGRLGDDPSDPKHYIPGDLSHPNDAPILRLLASAYADRPGYDESWQL